MAENDQRLRSLTPAVQQVHTVPEVPTIMPSAARLSPGQSVLRIASCAAAYFLAHQLAFLFPNSEQAIMAVWPAGGVGLAALLLNPRRLWPALLVSFYIAGVAADVFLVGRPFLAGAGYMAGNIVESLGCAWLILRWADGKVRFTRVSEVLALIVGAVGVNACSACIGATTATLVRGASFWHSWLSWYVSDGLGILLIAPFLVTWFGSWDLRRGVRWTRAAEWIAFLVLWCAAAWLSFQASSISQAFTPRPYMFIAMLAWPALRLGQRAVTLALVILSGIAITSSAVTVGPSPCGGDNLTERLLLLQVFLGFAGATGFLLAAIHTEAISAEKAVRESEERFRNLSSIATEGIMIHEGGTILDVNQAFVDILGYTSPDDLIGKNGLEIVPFTPESRQRLLDHIRAESVDTYDVEILRPNGTIIPAETCGRKITYQGREARLVYMRDITERKRAEVALRESEQRYYQIARCVPDLIWTIDLSGRFTYANAAVDRTHGWSAEEFLNLSYRDVVTPEQAVIDAAMIEEELRKATTTHFDHNTVRTYQSEEFRKDGSTFWAEISAAFLWSDDGQPVGIIGLTRDITDRKRAEEQLKALNETLEQRVAERTAEAEWRASQLQRLAAELTHVEQRERQQLAQILHDNLQQQLVAAKFNVTILRRRLTDSEQLRFVQKVDELLDESLGTSRSLTAELSPPILYEGNLAQVLHWLGRRVQEKHGLSVTVTAEEMADPVSSEVRVMLFQAVRELLLNITKHAGVDRARISLTRLGADQVQILVTDEGGGFDPAQKQTEQAGAASTSRFGLFGIRERLELLGGRMEIDSRPGKGTRVVLVAPCRLPGEEVGAAGETAAEQPAEVGRAGGRDTACDEKIIHVMLADDHAVVRDGLAMLLQSQPDMEVAGQAADGQEAVTLALQLRPEVILMDVSMPVMSGVEATRRITQQLPDVRVIGLSMHAQEDVAVQMKAAGAVDYLTKTAPPDTVITAIRECVGRPADRTSR